MIISTTPLRKRKTAKRAVLLLCFTCALILLFSVPSFARGKKRIAILGDSYSAYFGMIPNGYECSYAIHGKDGENKWPNNINSVKQMWWYKLIKTGRYKLTVNCSWSGSCFGYIYKGGKRNNREAFINRMRTYLNGRKTKADIIFVEGGTNDSWRKRPIGKLKYSKWTTKDLYKALPSFCYILNFLNNRYPKAQIIVMINDKYTKSKLVSGMEKACEHYDIPYLLLGNISTQSRHPSRKGQNQIYKTVLTFMKNQDIL